MRPGEGLYPAFPETAVLVAEPRVVKELLGTDLESLFAIKADFETESSEHIRLIPFSTVGSSGLLKAVLIDKVSMPKTGYVVHHVLLAQCKGATVSDEYSVLLSSDFLERGTYEHDKQKASTLAAKN